MLMTFSVENHRSIHERVTLSMQANSNDAFEETLIHMPDGERLLPSIALYGANAAGKSNFMHALHIMWNMVSMDEPLQAALPYEPYVFAQTHAPTKMDIVFYQNKTKYAYGFSFNSEEILTEYMHYWPSRGEQELLFERNNGTYVFAHSKSSQMKYAMQTPANMLYFANCGEWRVPKLRDAYDWFVRQTFPVIQAESLYPETGASLKLVDQEQYARVIEELIKSDCGISEIKLSRQYDPRNAGIYVKRRAVVDGGVMTSSLSIEKESKGIKGYFSLLSLLGLVFRFGGTIPLDDIDSGMHPLQKQRIIRLFGDKKTNANGAQFLFSTHDIALLDLSLLRPDQIWFAQKDPDTLATQIYPLSDFSPQQSENVREGYLSGKYCRLPIVDGLCPPAQEGMLL